MMPYTMKDLVAKQVIFSQHAFGPGARTEGLRRHIGKELDEIRDDPKDVLEWIDVVILGMDGAWRCLREQYPWMTPDELGSLIAKALQYKMDINSQRKWPDWREAGQDKPIEHEKGGARATSGEHIMGSGISKDVSRETYPPKCEVCGGSGAYRRAGHAYTATCPECQGTGV